MIEACMPVPLVSIVSMPAESTIVRCIGVASKR
jgi:hypothetical protein